MASNIYQDLPLWILSNFDQFFVQQKILQSWRNDKGFVSLTILAKINDFLKITKTASICSKWLLMIIFRKFLSFEKIVNFGNNDKDTSYHFGQNFRYFENFKNYLNMLKRLSLITFLGTEKFVNFGQNDKGYISYHFLPNLMILENFKNCLIMLKMASNIYDKWSILVFAHYWSVFRTPKNSSILAKW